MGVREDSDGLLSSAELLSVRQDGGAAYRVEGRDSLEPFPNQTLQTLSTS